MRKTRIALSIAAILTASSIFPEAVSASDSFPTPPSEHPRLYLRSSDIPSLKAKLATDQGKEILLKMEKMARPRSEAEERRERGKKGWDDHTSYYLKMRGVTTHCELQALDYILNGNRESARSAITAALDTLGKANYGTRNDMSRVAGRLLVTGATVYDWCHDCLTEEEKQAYIREFTRIAGTMEAKYPPRASESITGHLCEWIILRDYLSVGIAIYDECPEFYNNVCSLLYGTYFPVRNYVHENARSYHQGASYINIRCSSDIYANWIFQKMGAPRPIRDDVHFVPYEIIYRRRPDGMILPSGDMNPQTGESPYTVTDIMMLAGYLYKDPYLLGEYRLSPEGATPQATLFELLWSDFSLEPKGPEELPLTSYSGGIYGWTFARTGWDGNAVVAEMKVTEKAANNHGHNDGGSFQIYYKGPLAIDTGRYTGTSGPYTSPHGSNYFRRTIAHNSLLIYDPDEKFLSFRNKIFSDNTYAANDGGQRLCGYGWKSCNDLDSLKSPEHTVGKVLAHFESDSFSYLKGDLTPGYNSRKASDVRRSFVFENLSDSKVPAAMVIFDHIVSTDRSFRKYFLLHTVEEPAILKGGFKVARTGNGYGGELLCTTLLPMKADISKVGGPGKEFWVFGKNWENIGPDPLGEGGRWRVEVSPSTPAEEDCFLNVIQVSDAGSKAYGKVSRIDGKEVVAACFASRVISFSRSGRTLGGKFTLPRPASKGVYTVMATDLEAGSWTVRTASGKTVGKYEVTEGANFIRIPSVTFKENLVFSR